MTRARDIADLAGGGTLLTRQLFTATAGQTTFTPSAGYNPGALEVFMNGLMLLASDYTATNSSTVVLGVAANAGDEVEILTYQINTIGDTVSASNGGTFTSDVIFDENVLVGTATTGSNTASVEIKPSGFIAAIRDGNKVMTMNRLSSDGEILRFQKDGTTVGSIGVNSGDNLYLAGGTGSTKGIYFNDHGMVPADTGGSPLDNGADLGVSNNRWKDLYLSGGVYLGGTGSANKLDDYEEGQHTLTINQGGISINSSYADAVYTKVGRLVTIQGLLLASSSGDTNILKINLPFVSKSRTGTQTDYYIGSAMPYNVPTGTGGLVPYIVQNQDKMAFLMTVNNGTWTTLNGTDINNGDHIYFSISYMTN